MSTKLKFYQNNPCVILKDINDDFAEVMISHKFAEDMEAKGFCEGCMIGDSDNKLSCSCDDYSWVIEQVQEEENKVICIVEKRLLLDKPIETAKINRLQQLIEQEQSKLSSVKDSHTDWSGHLSVIKSKVESLKTKKEAFEKELKALEKENLSLEERNSSVRNRFEKMIVEVEAFSVKPKRISNKEYEKLLERDRILSALEDGGVDNWEWYSESLSKLDGE